MIAAPTPSAAELVAAVLPDLAGLPTWPPDAETIRRLVEAGIGDARSARLFGVHPRTYSSRRRKLLGACRPGGDGDPPDPAEYGFDPAARWPEWARF